jgi:small-conductance mechanosensitive channel
MLEGVMRATLSYTVLRLLLFFAAILVLYWAGVGGFMLVILAALISALISYVVLSRYRDAMSRSLTGRLTRFRERLDEGTRSEDVD